MAGHLFLRRLFLFVDYQNAYMQARRCFAGASAPGVAGQFDPVALGELIVRRRDEAGLACGLEQVRIYRGLPQAVRDPRGYMAADRQNVAWTRDRRAVVVTRPLRYPRTRPPSRPQEKGIDVRLAIDFVAMALRGEYDVGVLLSSDTDLAPALEAVLDLSTSARPEIAAWAPQRGSINRLRVPGRSVWCHYLTAADYAAVADTRNYARA
jgi:uncharacterized LabA/DUF88 family protein